MNYKKELCEQEFFVIIEIYVKIHLYWGIEYMLNEEIEITDYLDIDFLQMLQDNCSRALGLAFVMVDYRGRPITRYSGFTPYCLLGREHQDFFEMCKQCDAHGGLQAVITGQPCIYRCHAGLLDFALPLMCDGTYVGSLLGGQVRLSPDEEGGLEDIVSAKTDWKKDKALDKAYNEMQPISYEKVKSAVTLLRDLLELVMQNGVQMKQAKNEEKAKQPEKGKQTGPVKEKKEIEQTIEEKPGVIREFSFKKNELASIKHQGRLRYFFFVMNIISQFAFQEKAVKTESLIYDFADIMRYISETDNDLSTLGEELSYIGALLRIQKAWVGDTLNYSISVPEQYWGVNCPYMVMEPLVGLAVLGCENGDMRKIEILATGEQGDVLVQVISDREMPLEEMERKPGISSQEDAFSMYDSNRSLKRMFGKDYGLSIGPRKDGQAGHAVSFRLPQKKEEYGQKEICV